MNTVLPIIKYISKNQAVLFLGIILILISVQMILTLLIKKRRVRRRIKRIRSQKTASNAKSNLFRKS